MSAPCPGSDGSGSSDNRAARPRWSKARRSTISVGSVLGGLVTLLGVLFVAGRILISRVESENDPHVFAPWGPNTKFVTTNAGESHVLDVGQGKVILLIHGSTGSIADWQEEVVERLAESYRVVAFDSFGFGLSERDGSLDYGYRLWTRQAIELLDALEIDRAVVVGHSAGGLATAILAGRHPERFRGAVITGHGLSFDVSQLAPVIPGVGEIWAARRRIIGDAFSEDYRKHAEEVHQIDGTRRAYLAFIRSQYSFATLDYLNVYEEIEIPVLQMHAKDDGSIPVGAARKVASRISNSRFVAFENSGHFIHIDEPDRWIDEVTTFVEELAD